MHTKDWLNELNEKIWDDGIYKCVILRNQSKILCGYVGIPSSHPYYKVDHDDLQLTVHGGLTYSEPNLYRGSEQFENLWWIGFDCAHMSDYVPQFEDFSWGGTYRNMPYVINEVTRLVEQLRTKEV